MHFRLILIRMYFGRIACAVAAAFLIGGDAIAKGSNYRSDDRYNPQHITSLPPEVRAVVEHECSDPRALHEFAAYDEGRRIVLHYEHFYCQGHDVFCKAEGCLHQVYVPSGGHYRLQRSYYAPN